MIHDNIDGVGGSTKQSKRKRKRKCVSIVTSASVKSSCSTNLTINGSESSESVANETEECMKPFRAPRSLVDISAISAKLGQNMITTSVYQDHQFEAKFVEYIIDKHLIPKVAPAIERLILPHLIDVCSSQHSFYQQCQYGGGFVPSDIVETAFATFCKKHVKLYRLSGMKSGASSIVQLPCYNCNAKTQWYCKGCFEDHPQLPPLAFCSPITTDRDCLYTHIDEYARGSVRIHYLASLIENSRREEEKNEQERENVCNGANVNVD